MVHAEASTRLKDVVGAHHIVLKRPGIRSLSWSGYRGQMHHRVGRPTQIDTGNRLEHLAEILQIDVEIWTLRCGRWHEIDVHHIVSARDHIRHNGAAELSAPSGNEGVHGAT